MIPVVSVVGYGNSGKTTLLVKLIRELKARGYRVATIKHHHRDFEIDIPGKDTWRHREAGADTVVLASPAKIAVIEQTEQELSLDEVIAKISGVDIIITEGFKKENKPKIEVFRSDVHAELITQKSQLLAVASDIPHPGVRVFGLDDASGLIDLLVEELGLKKQNI